MHFLKRQHIIASALFLVFAGLYTSLVLSVNTQGLLSGEEVSVSIRDVLFLQERLQHNAMATNWGGHVLYAMASSLSGDSIFYGRFFKAMAMALLPAIAFLFMIRSLRCRLGTACFAGLGVGLLPGITAFSWMATEYGLSLGGMLLALMLADSQSPGRRVGACGLATLTALIYPPGIAALPAVLGHTLKRMRRGCWKGESLVLLRSLLTMALVLCIPRLWWINDAHLLTGGGALDPSRFGANILGLLGEFFTAPASYYYFAQDPPLGHMICAVLCMVAALVGVIRYWTRVWPLAVLLLAALGLYGLSGGVSGIRRALVVVVVLLLLGAFMLEQINARLATSAAPAVRTLMRLVPLVLILYYATLFVGYRANLNDDCGQIRLPTDFAFPSNASMPETLERIYMETGGSAWRVPAGFERDRLYAMLLWQARAHDDTARVKRFEKRLFDQ